MNKVSYKRKKRPGRPNTNFRRNNAGIDVHRYITEGQGLVAQKPYENQCVFEDFQLDSRLVKLIAKKGYQQPTEIQDRSINPILEGKDLIGIAGTGTGKTAAFLIPIIQQLITHRQANYALIITPTRELANQIHDEFRSLTHGLDLYSTKLIGGTSVSESIMSLKRKSHIIVGTPGRLQDMAQQKALDFRTFNLLVLDEFDRMLDMGFSREIQKINRQMHSKDQTLLFSATLEPSQRRLIDEMTRQPVQVHTKRATHQSGAIDQKVVRTRGQDKFGVLTGILSDPMGTKTILFCETKRHADRMSKKLQGQQFRADAIHGNKSQRQRERALSRFKKGKVTILVATDVVARGIDVSDVELIINYQAPRNITDYVHRIGRTGRAGKIGRAITLVD